MSELTPTPAATTIDLTGLPEPVIEQVRQLVAEARRNAGSAASLPLPPDQWRAELAAWKKDAEHRAGRYPPGHVLDDSRDAIYGERERV